MTTMTASRQITDEVTTWPGVHTAWGTRGEFSFRLARRELGHLHGDHSAHFTFPKDVWHALHEQERIDYHPVFPGRVGPAARRINSPADGLDVIELMRLNYDRLRARDQVAAGAKR
jgi:hypothetical protein